MKKVAVTRVDKNEFFSDEKELIIDYKYGHHHHRTLTAHSNACHDDGQGFFFWTYILIISFEETTTTCTVTPLTGSWGFVFIFIRRFPFLLEVFSFFLLFYY